VTSAVHDRMPMILDPGNYDVWLDPGMKNADALSDMLKPFDPDLMRSYPVSNRVNYAVNDDEDCSMPEKLVQKQSSLFS
jgi:putative SOS response-associated peptidase YedK